MSVSSRKTDELIFTGNAGIVYETAQKLSQSVHSDVYRKAHDLTAQIIEQNALLSDSKEKRKYEDGYSTDVRNMEQLNNVLYFLGRRGTGKTSAMLSYMEFLKDYYRKANRMSGTELPKEMLFSEKKLMFTGLEYIDASKLAPKENIMGVIWAKMIKKWKDEEKNSRFDKGLQMDADYEYKKRQFMHQLDEVYKCLSVLKTTKDILDPEDDMVLDTLTKLSFTVNLKSSFEKLVQQYVDIMQYTGTERVIHYLVISIDDVDMNIKKGYEILEDIRNYLMIPNIIVLMSAQYEQLERICRDHYTGEFNKESVKDVDTQELASEYLEKIVPIKNQIAMENILEKTIWNDKMVFKYAGRTGKVEKLRGETLQGVIRNLLFSRFGIRFSQNSKCLKKIMPRTLRDANEWIGEMASLQQLFESAENTSIDVGKYKKNMNCFWKQIFLKVVRRSSTLSLRNKVESVQKLDVFEQKNWLKREFELYDLDDKTEQSIAEIFWLVYCEEKGICSERFSILLLYFTARLTELMICAAHSNGREAEICLGELRNYYRGGLFGASENNMFPQLMRSSFSAKKTEDDNYYKGSLYSDFACNEVNQTDEILGLDKLFNDGDFDYDIYIMFLYFYSFCGKPRYSVRIDEEKQKHVFFIHPKKGQMSLSGALIKQCIGSEFIDNMVESLPKNYLSDSDSIVQSMIKRKVPAGKKYEYFPLNSLEYIINMGEYLSGDNIGTLSLSGEDEKSWLPKYEECLSAYFGKIKSCFKELDEKYDSHYSEAFEESPLKLMINNKQKLRKLAEELAITLKWDSYRNIWDEDDEEDWGRN